MTIELATISTTRPSDDKVSGRTFADSNDTERSTTSAIGLGSPHLVDSVLAGVNSAWQTVAAPVRAIDLDTPVRHVVSEGSHRLEVDGVPS